MSLSLTESKETFQHISRCLIRCLLEDMKTALNLEIVSAAKKILSKLNVLLLQLIIRRCSLF